VSKSIEASETVHRLLLTCERLQLHKSESELTWISFKRLSLDVERRFCNSSQCHIITYQTQLKQHVISGSYAETLPGFY